jgi:hypothetical protein
MRDFDRCAAPPAPSPLDRQLSCDNLDPRIESTSLCEREGGAVKYSHLAKFSEARFWHTKLQTEECTV